MENTKGALIGLVWGLVSIPIYSTIKDTDSSSAKTIKTIAGLPTYIALKSGAQFQYIFVGSPLVGMGIGAGTGYLINK